jgi:ATP synthase I chain
MDHARGTSAGLRGRIYRIDTRDPPGQQGIMSSPSEGQSAAQSDVFLSGAYGRMRRITIVLALAGTMIAAIFFGWRNGLGLAAGAVVGYFNFVWLHRAARMMIERMMPSAETAPSRFRVLLGFAGRYAFVVVAAYVILKSWPEVLVAFLVALFFPIVAAMCEGVYEAVAGGKMDPPVN